jgi:hypothetical protein
MKTKLFASVISLQFLYALPAFAQSLSVNDPYLQWYNVGPNDLSFFSGETIRYGATDVTPNGFSNPPTVGTASTTNLSTGATIRARSA